MAQENRMASCKEHDNEELLKRKLRLPSDLQAKPRMKKGFDCVQHCIGVPQVQEQKCPSQKQEQGT